MAAPRKWTDEQIAQALELYERHGVAHAARETGLPAGTIKAYAHRNGNVTVAIAHTREATLAAQQQNDLRRQRVKTKVLEKSEYALDRIGDEETPTGCQALATTAAILVDKHLLMSGEATSRHEHQGSEFDRLIHQRLEQMRQEKLGASADDGLVNQPNAIEAESRSA